MCRREVVPDVTKGQDTTLFRLKQVPHSVNTNVCLSSQLSQRPIIRGNQSSSVSCACIIPSRILCACIVPSRILCACIVPSRILCACIIPSRILCACIIPSRILCACIVPSRILCACIVPSRILCACIVPSRILCQVRNTDVYQFPCRSACGRNTLYMSQSMAERVVFR